MISTMVQFLYYGLKIQNKKGISYLKLIIIYTIIKTLINKQSCHIKHNIDFYSKYSLVQY